LKPRRGFRSIGDNRGQSLVEFSLVAFLSVMLLLGTFEMCRMVLVYTTVANAARAGARYAIVHGSDAATTSTVIQGQVENYLAAAPMQTTIPPLTIAVSYPDTGNCTDPGCHVNVTVTYPYDPFISYFFPATINLSSTTQGVITY
jgi:Flp pilus assembly protein TadG